MLRRVPKLTLTLLLLGAAAALPAGADPRDARRFDKLIGKYAVTQEETFEKFRPKLACACKDALPARAGFLLVDRATREYFCGVPDFVGGELQSFGPCQDFVIIRR